MNTERRNFESKINFYYTICICVFTSSLFLLVVVVAGKIREKNVIFCHKFVLFCDHSKAIFINDCSKRNFVFYRELHSNSHSLARCTLYIRHNLLLLCWRFIYSKCKFIFCYELSWSSVFFSLSIVVALQLPQTIPKCGSMWLIGYTIDVLLVVAYAIAWEERRKIKRTQREGGREVERERESESKSPDCCCLAINSLKCIDVDNNTKYIQMILLNFNFKFIQWNLLCNLHTIRIGDNRKMHSGDGAAWCVRAHRIGINFNSNSIYKIHMHRVCLVWISTKRTNRPTAHSYEYCHIVCLAIEHKLSHSGLRMRYTNTNSALNEKWLRHISSILLINNMP